MSPNLSLSNLCHMPIYEANFGWGRPIFLRLLVTADATTHILPSPSNDGSLYVVIDLEIQHMSKLFKKKFYEISHLWLRVLTKILIHLLCEFYCLYLFNCVKF